MPAKLLAGIGALTNAISIAKTLREIEKNYDAATLKGKIAELLDGLVDAKLALTEAKDQISDLNAENERLRRAFEERSSLTEHRGYQYRVGDSGNPSGYPLCPKCLQLDGRMVSLVRDGVAYKGVCPVCQTHYHPVQRFDAAADAEEAAQRERTEAVLRESGRRLAGRP